MRSHTYDDKGVVLASFYISSGGGGFTLGSREYRANVAGGTRFSRGVSWRYEALFTKRYGGTVLPRGTETFFGFAYAKEDTGAPNYDSHAREVVMPWLFPILVFAGLPSLRLHLFLKARRLRLRLQQGRCLKCGYDLRGSAANCPECGADVAKP